MNRVNISLFFIVETHASGCPCCDDTTEVKSGPFVTLEQAKQSIKDHQYLGEGKLTVVEYELDPSKLCNRY